MKKHSKKSLVLILICMMGIISIAHSQSVYKVEDTKDIDMKLLGTSTMHKWEMDASTVMGEAQFVFKKGSETALVSIKSLSFDLKVKDLKSDNKGLDKNAYKALKSDDHEEINYKLTSAKPSPEKGGYLLKTKGKLTIAGVTKDILMDVHCIVNKDGTVAFTGSHKLNMTDYKVEPPSFLLGAMKTGDAITLDFTIVYKKGKGV